MFTAHDVLFGVLLPVVVPAVMLGWLITLRRSVAGAPSELSPSAGELARGDWIGPAAIGAGFAAGFVGVLGVPPFPAVDSTDWFFALAILLAVSGIIESLWRLPVWCRWINFLADAAITIALLAWPLVRNSDNPMRVIGTLAALFVVLVICWERLAAPGRDWPALETCCATALVAMTLMMSGSKKLGQLAGMLAAALGPFVIACWCTRRIRVGSGTATVVMLLVFGLLLCGRYFANLTATNGVLLWCGLVAAGARDRIPGIERLRPWQQTVVGLVAVAVFSGTAAVIAAIEFARSMSEYGY